MDTTGEQHLHIEHNIFKRRLDLNGKPIEDPQRTSMYSSFDSYVQYQNRVGTFL